MALRRPPTTFSDSIDAADLAANSVTSSELADNAVDAAAIAANAVTTAKIADSSSTTTGITPAKIAENAVTSAKIATGAVIADGIGAGAVVAAGLGTGAVTTVKIAADVLEVKPHIIPGVLYPAIKDSGGTVRQIDGVTAVVASTVGPAGSAIASSLYGTVQSDGRMYYYTDIKGSKPIKDPRIGSHFGSQRHKFKSIQLLEQETATHGTNVYSVDGREWIRGEGNAQQVENDASGVKLRLYGNDNRIEIVGYFNDANILFANLGATISFNVYINGGTVQLNNTAATISAQPTETLRYVDPSVCFNLSFNSTPTLGINTLRIETTGGDQVYCSGIELITQDTTSVATKSQIQIHPQNVVSYGKRFAIDDTALHYNPFATKGDGTTASTIPNNTTGDSVATGWAGSTSAYWDSSLDTATSLGLAAWVEGGAYYRPVNGGRIVKWVDSTGTIKTSVNMMPPSAKAIGSHSGDATPTGATNWSTQYLPIFSTGTADHTQAEVAKTFGVHEYGNGEANGNTSYRDMSMRGPSGTAGFQNIAYVMDDGLTAMSAQNVASWNTAGASVYSQAQKPFFYTFIGTGISVESAHPAGKVHNIAQNLPYGTHILKIDSTSGHSTTVITLDGVQLNSSTTYLTYAAHGKLSFHQPKMLPIPEDAVVLADYMLMADFVKQTDIEDTQISKGVRYCNGSRDHFYAGAAAGASIVSNHASGWHFRGLSGGSSPSSPNGNGVWRLPFFGTTGLSLMEGSQVAHSIRLGGSATTETALDYSTTQQGDAMSIAESVTLGQTEIETSLLQGSYHFYGHFVASPIHTSSHYQTFETPYLHELVGGDRNMEQTNLVVTADGKTWDEVTRDTSYIGNTVLAITREGGDISGSATMIFDFHRGINKRNAIGKSNFAYGYDRIICLIDGEYHIEANFQGRTGGTAGFAALWLNGAVHLIREFDSEASGRGLAMITTLIPMKRGDYIHFPVNDIEASTGEYMSWLTITKA
jgi:hypothetical protein